MNKKLRSVIIAAAMATAALPTLAACGGNKRPGNADFAVVTIKEDSVNDYNSMPVFASLAAETGVKVYWDQITSSQYANSKSRRITSKNNDAIYHAAFTDTELYNYGRRGRIVAIDQHLDDMPNFSRILNARPDIKEALKSPDGHIYSLPRVEEMGLKQHPNILFLNKTWLEKIRRSLSFKSKLPRTITDGLKLTRKQFKEILEKFRDGDMNGDGRKDDEIPLSFVHGNWQGNDSDFIASFGIPENRDHKTIVNGRVTFTLEDERWFDAIKELNTWYRENLIDRSAYDSTKTQDAFLAKGKDNSAGYPLYGAFYWWEKETVVSSKRYDEYIIVQPLVGDDGKQYVGTSNELEVEKGECVILNSSDTDKCKLLSYFDKFYEPDYSAQLNYGSIGVAFEEEKDEHGMLVPKAPPEGQNADDFRMKNAPYGIVYLTQDQWQNNVQMEERATLRLQRLQDYVLPYVMPGVSQIPNLNYSADELKTLLNYELFFGNQVETYIVNSITQGTPSKSGWQDMLKSVSSALSAIKRVNQDGYDRYLAAQLAEEE